MLDKNREISGFVESNQQVLGPVAESEAVILVKKTKKKENKNIYFATRKQENIIRMHVSGFIMVFFPFPFLLFHLLMSAYCGE